MKVITKYVADDNTEFNNYDDCVKYEALANRLSALLSGLANFDRFPYERGFLQHPQGTRTRLENALKIEASAYFGRDFSDSSVTGLMGRYIDDAGIRCFNKITHRISSMTADDKEYNQPYYAFHPEKADNIQLN